MDEDYTQWKKRKDNWWSKLSKQIKPIHILIFAFLIYLGNRAVSKGDLNKNSFFWMIGIFIVLILFLIKRESSVSKLIPEHIIKQIAYEALEKKRIEQSTKEIPFDCKVKISLVGECKYEQDFVSGTSGIIRRDVGFEIVRKGFRKKGVIGIHPYSGIIMGIRFEPLGYTGKETKDIKIIGVDVLKKE